MSDTNLIITGKTGEAHISSGDDGSLHGAIFGEGDYILDRGAHLEATLSGQIVTVQNGDLMMQGRHARIQGSETVTIQAPTNGTARYTDICFRYFKDLGDNSNESMTLVGVNGPETSQSGEPTAPTLEKGNIFNGGVEREVRLCRVLYDTRGGTTSITLLTEGMNEFIVKGNVNEQVEEVREKLDEVRTETRPISAGGTGATNAKDARENLGLGVVIWEGTTSSSGRFHMTQDELNLLKSFNVIRVIGEDGRKYVLNHVISDDFFETEPSRDNEKFISTDILYSRIICFCLGLPLVAGGYSFCDRYEYSFGQPIASQQGVKIVKIIGVI